jgi:putative addiction module CopG family antidote
MNITLPPELKKFVEQKVASGAYEAEAEVIHEALRWSQTRDRAFSWARTTASVSSASPSGNWPLLGGESGVDIMALACLVMMEAARSAEEDLKAVLAGMKAINAAKSALRDLIARVSKDVSSNLGRGDKKASLDLSNGMGSERAYHRVKMPHPDTESQGGVKFVSADLHPGKISDIRQLEAVRDDLRDDLDSMSEMGEMESLRLQMAMDRVSKFMSTLSNILKKSSDTAQSIIQNLK